MHLTLYADGGARGNPGPAAGGFVIYHKGKKLEEGGKFLGNQTNNVAEYLAVYMGVIKARELGATKLDIILDSELIVKQLNREYKVRKKELYKIYKDILKELDRIEWTAKHVKRELNKEADAIVNMILDANK